MRISSDDLSTVIDVLRKMEKQMEMDKRLENLDKRLENLDKRLENLDNRLEHLDNRLENLDNRLENLDNKVERVSQYYFASSSSFVCLFNLFLETLDLIRRIF